MNHNVQLMTYQISKFYLDDGNEQAAQLEAKTNASVITNKPVVRGTPRDVIHLQTSFRAKELQAPASLETVHRKIMGAAHAVEADLTHFQSRQLAHTTVNPDWADFVQNLCTRHNKEARDLNDFNDLKALLEREAAGPPSPRKETRSGTRYSRVKTTAKPASRGTNQTSDSTSTRYLFEHKEPMEFVEYNELKRVCERGQMFDYVAVSVWKQLETAYTSQLKKYCLSFVSDGKGEALSSVRDYENRIIRWSEDIQAKLDKIKDILDENDSLKNDVTKYVTEYERVLTLMTDACKTMFQMIDPMKKWVSSDATYARRVQEEINVKNRRKMELKDKCKALEDKLENVGGTTRRKAFNCIKYEQELQRIRDSKKHMKRRELELGDFVAKLNGDIRRKKRELDEIKSRLITRKENSPTVFNYLSSMNETLKDDIRALEGRVRSHQDQMTSLQKQQIDTQKEIDKATRELRDNQRSHERTYSRMEQAEGDLRQVRDDLQRVENQIQVLKRIREIKLHANTVKKIYQFGYQPGNMQNRDELDEAIHITAESLGKDWAQLYQKLPFKPYRDFENRSRDIEAKRKSRKRRALTHALSQSLPEIKLGGEIQLHKEVSWLPPITVIDLSTRRVQSGGFRTVALKSLEKWRRLHTMPTLDDLVRTLRRLRKKDTVQRIQKEVMLASPVERKHHRQHNKWKHSYAAS